MTDAVNTPAATPERSLFAADARTSRRNRSEKRFRAYGMAAVGIGILALIVLLISILGNGLSAFKQTYISYPLELTEERLDPDGNRDPGEMARVTTFGYLPVLAMSLEAWLEAEGIEHEMGGRELAAMLSEEAPAQIRAMVLANPDLIGQTIDVQILLGGRIDGFFKGRVTMETAERDRNVSVNQLLLAQTLAERGDVVTRFNWDFITWPDASGSRPEAAGLGVAIIGSLYMMIVVLVLALPIGVAASIYLEEFAPTNRLTDLIEVNISNLAAVPSIVYGILGLAVFINFMEFNQSSPLVGGLVLTLMTLPTIIIATRASLRAVPPSIRQAALGLGASKMQSVFHHVLPLAMPGILTGTIIGLAQALGETAPLLLIGMVAFVREYPDLVSSHSNSFPLMGDGATALPVQVYSWTQRSDPAFVERASGAIIVLLIFLLIMNAIAILLRRRFERRW
ncbi:phosphate ABC transporter permease PstA [Rhodobacteraceae bacterium N5(2021)]|uniref:Phosphate transport system permease protein PstA n=1 Tax=Gymnodinialimonas phycosphaerae TaxID=2841589 RepID=A0A975YGX1_9RHOB|nr:phosphate ABC transporter permease PstA [Gymnodinialimonas phycosphaerae]MBY4892170.1 phosphate ABC transporter permease PstA [Gymnodinialimonas phycosphaerae]